MFAPPVAPTPTPTPTPDLDIRRRACQLAMLVRKGQRGFGNRFGELCRSPVDSHCDFLSALPPLMMLPVDEFMAPRAPFMACPRNEVMIRDLLQKRLGGGKLTFGDRVAVGSQFLAIAILNAFGHVACQLDGGNDSDEALFQALLSEFATDKWTCLDDLAHNQLFHYALSELAMTKGAMIAMEVIPLNGEPQPGDSALTTLDSLAHCLGALMPQHKELLAGMSRKIVFPAKKRSNKKRVCESPLPLRSSPKEQQQQVKDDDDELHYSPPSPRYSPQSPQYSPRYSPFSTATPPQSPTHQPSQVMV